MFFNSQFLKVDITVVKSYRYFFLIGIGGSLHIFDRNASKFINKIDVFDGRKIYGIVVNKSENKVLLHGERFIKVFNINALLTDFDEYSHVAASDWILDAKWTNDDQHIVTVSMHNKCQIWNESLEVVTELQCEVKCILYSAHICYESLNDLVILSGTVFNEVLIWKPVKNKNQDCTVLKKLQHHKGVIFSLHYNESSGYICSTSDDRSAILWKIKSKSLRSELEEANIEINLACQVFGHLSRVFRSRVLKDCFLTGGEDSLLNIWSFNGNLIRKVETHQGGPIWALDCDEEHNIIVTGGSDCGVITFPINSKLTESQFSLPNSSVPKSLGLLASNNIAVMSENGILYYKEQNETCQIVATLKDMQNYSLLVPSHCKKLVALAGFHGQIYIFKEENTELELITFFQTKCKSRIYSFHWLDCRTFLICQDGGKMTLMYLKDRTIFPIATFILPLSKERWSTTAAFLKNDKLVVGDRKGHIYLYQFGAVNPIQTIRKAHSYLGVTNIIIQNDTIKSMGRNGIIKNFILKNGMLHILSSEKLPFSWLSGFIDSLLLGFSGNNFIIWNYASKRLVFERLCGGGHRSWSFLKNINTTTFCYIKEKMINCINFNLSNFLSLDIIEGYHVKEINAVEVIKIRGKFLLISGGEDTTLRINLSDSNGISNLLSLKSHLSSIRAITSFKLDTKSNKNKQKHLLFTAGGRAQVICWKLVIFMENNSFKNIVCCEEHSYYKKISREESEMRIMDLCAIEMNSTLLLFCACSDGNIKVFTVGANCDKMYHLTFRQDIFYKLKCIIKVRTICVLTRNVLVTMATDGKLIFWEVTDILETQNTLTPFHEIKVHQSGINSCAFKLLKEDVCLCVTGGDDNAIVLSLIRFYLVDNTLKIEALHSFTDVTIHCAQITGVFMSQQYIITASIDQRIAIMEWYIHNNKIVCKYLTKYNTAVADIQGINCFESDDFDAFVYGKGLEYITIKRPER